MDNKDKIIRELNEDYKSVCEEYKKLKKAYEAVVIENIELQQTIENLNFLLFCKRLRGNNYE